MTVELNLPTFALDCRDWLVTTEAENVMAEHADAAPVVAVLSTALVVGDELVSAQAVLSLALLDEDAEIAFADAADNNAAAGLAADGPDADDLTDADPSDHRAQWAGQDICVLAADWSAGYARSAVPAPAGDLAIVAEFVSVPGPSQQLIDRFYDLVTSFRWAA
jgi:hypothetical protein